MPNQLGQTVSTVQFATELISDYLAVIAKPADTTLVLLAIAQNGLTGTPEPVVVDSANDIWFYRANPSSNSGYAAEKIPITAPSSAQGNISGVYAFYGAGQSNAPGQPNVIATWASTATNEGQNPLAWTWMASSAPQQWAVPTFSTLSEPIGSTIVNQVGIYEDASANSFVYFLTTQIETTTGSRPGLYLASAAGTPLGWTPIYALPSSVTQPDSIYDVCAGRTGTSDQFTIIGVVPGTATINYVGGSLPAAGSESMVFDISAPITVNPGLPPNQTIVDLVSAAGDPNDVFIVTADSTSSAQRLFLLVNYAGADPVLTELTSATGEASVKNLAIARDEEGLYAIFATDAVTSHLLVSRQTDPAVFAFPSWSDLGDVATQVEVPPFMFDALEAFYIDETNTLQFKSQAQPDQGGLWTTLPVQQAAGGSDTFPSQSTYTMHALAVDQNGAPVPFATGAFTTDVMTAAIVNGAAMPYRPGQAPIPVTANFDGQIYFQFPLDERFSAPMVTLQMDDLNSQQQPPPQYLDATTLPRIAGQDPTWPVTPESLKNFGLAGQHEDDAQLQNWIDSVQELVQAITQSRTADNLGPNAARPSLTTHAWVYRRPAKGAPIQVTQVPSLESAIASMYPQAGVLDWLGETFGDVIEYGWQQIQEITDFGWEVSSGSVRYWIQAGKQKLTETTVYVASKLEAILKTGMNFLDEATVTIKNWADFFANLLSWPDIVNTQKVLAHVISTSLTFASGWVQNVASGWVAEQAQSLHSGVNYAFSQLQSSFGSNSITQYMQNLNQNPDLLTTAGVAGVLNNPNNKVAFQWLYARTIGNSSINSQLNNDTVTVPASDTSALSNFYSLLSPQMTTSGSIASVGTSLAQGLSTTQVASPATLVLSNFLSAFQNFVNQVLTSLTNLAQGALSAVSGIIDSVQNVLTTPITGISFLNQLFGLVADNQPLNYLNFATLLAAVPVTIAYKLVNGSAPFSQAYVTQLLASSSIILPMPGSPQPSGTASPGPTGTINPQTGYNLTFIAGVFQCMQSFWDSANDLLYALEANQPKPMTAFPQVCGLINLIGAFAIGAPVVQLQTAVNDRTAADTGTIVAWGTLAPQLVGEAFLTVCDCLALAITNPSSFITAASTGPLKPIVKGATGAIALAGGVVGGVAQILNTSQTIYSGLTASSLILTPVPVATRIGLLLFNAKAGPLAAIYAAVQAYLDTVGTIVPGVLECIDAAGQMSTPVAAMLGQRATGVSAA